jgi:ABC-type Fe3+ transport system permease subunit
MKSWLALVVSPTIALATQGTLYSMVTPSCSAQTRVQLHLAAAVALTVVVVMAVLAFSESSLRRGEPVSHDSDEGQPHVRRRFLASMAAAVAALSALVILGMWFALWVLNPCEP